MSHRVHKTRTYADMLKKDAHKSISPPAGGTLVPPCLSAVLYDIVQVWYIFLAASTRVESPSLLEVERTVSSKVIT